MEKAILSGQHAYNEGMYTLFQATYFTRKQSLFYANFLAFYKLLLFVKSPIIATMYYDEKACTHFVWCISVVI